MRQNKLISLSAISRLYVVYLTHRRRRGTLFQTRSLELCGVGKSEIAVTCLVVSRRDEKRRFAFGIVYEAENQEVLIQILKQKTLRARRARKQEQ